MVRVLNVLRQPVVIVYGGAGIFNLLPIAYAFPPQLRDPTNPGKTSFTLETLGFRRGRFSLPLSFTHAMHYH
jgi:hypothetical protein